MRVDLYDDTRAPLRKAVTLLTAAAWMHIDVDLLRGFLRNDGYCLVDDPDVVWAFPAGADPAYWLADGGAS